MSVHLNTYQPWNPKRLALAKTAGIPFDLILRLSDHPVDTTKIKLEDYERVPVKVGVYKTVLSNRTKFDVAATVSLIKALSEQCAYYQTSTLATSPNKVLPFVCHFHAAPDPLSPAWLPIFTQLLEQTASFNVQWSIFTDGIFWSNPNKKTEQIASAQSYYDLQLEEKLRHLDKVIYALDDNRLNIMLYISQQCIDNTMASSYDRDQQYIRLQCRRQLYTFADLQAKSGLTNICAVIGPTYTNSRYLVKMMQEAVIAGAQPTLGHPQPFHDYRRFYQRYPFIGKPQHYRCANSDVDQITIDTFNDWCDRQEKPLPHYQPPACTIPSTTALFLDEDNVLSISAQSAYGCSCCEDVRHKLGLISGDDKLNLPAIQQLIKEYCKRHQRTHPQPSQDQNTCSFFCKCQSSR